MATAMSTYRYLDDVIHIIFSVKKISKDKKYKKQKKEEIVNTICALLNSNGGKVEIRGEETEGNLVSTTILDSLTRTLEQLSKSRFGAQIAESVTILGDKKEKVIKICVREAPFLVTIKCNLYRPTQKQVEFFGNDNLPNVEKILNRKCVDQAVQLESHHKRFLKGQNCELEENQVIQFKLLKSVSTKHATLADRMIGKSNKFSCYVSAFANHMGGHIYYGIDDHGVVQGQETKLTFEIENKVEKAIQKMIWPDGIGQAKRGELWEIFFEPVLDEKSNSIPSTFVIVIFIALCFGGVFTEEPESYEMVEGEVERMSFTTWKEKLQPVGLNKRKQEVPSTMKAISLSPAAKKCCTNVDEVLAEAMNNGDWKSFTKRASELEQKYPDNPEVKLLVLSRRVTACYRQGKIHKASILLTEYPKRICQAEQPLVFEVLLLFLRAVVARVSGKTTESRAIATDALCKADGLEPGLITTIPVFLVTASTYDVSQKDAKLTPDTLSIKAIQHLGRVQDPTTAQADMYHTAHIMSAAYHLGYNLSGKMIKEDMDKESLQKAKTSIMAINQSVCDGNPLPVYRKVWFTLLQSILYIRHSQLESERQEHCVKQAFRLAKEAENLAKLSGLEEMVCWAQTTSASCVEALLLAKLRRIRNIKLIYKVKQKLVTTM